MSKGPWTQKSTAAGHMFKERRGQRQSNHATHVYTGEKMRKKTSEIDRHTHTGTQYWMDSRDGASYNKIVGA